MISSRILLSAVVTAFWAATLRAVDLPDPLLTTGGVRITTAAAWEQMRRPELLELFREHVYGRAPVDRPAGMHFEPLEEATPAFDGMAVRKRVRIAYAGPGGEGGLTLTCYYPAKGKIKGCFVLIVNRSRKIIDAAEASQAAFWPVRDLIERGYATAAFHNGEVAPDNKADGFKSGVFGVFGPAGVERAGDAWASIAAWSWGASRAIDFLETEPRLTDVPMAVAGHSRGGKAALWCGAQDTRVALAISNDSGSTGASLARTTRGETIKKINATFPHWFASNYHLYDDREAELPVDQHELIALMAPRLVYVASASEDANADPQAEFRACVEAAPVYALYGLKGVGSPNFPAVDDTRHAGGIGYHIHEGKHDLTREDWRRYMDFADIHFAGKTRTMGGFMWPWHAR